MMSHPFATIEQAILEIQSGRMIILLDDENRENEGDLVIAAEFATADAINFMTKFGRGLVCLSMDNEQIDRLGLPMMTSNNRSPYRTGFTVSIEAATGVSTGISTQDRARTVLVAVDPASGPNDVISPGHIFPLRAAEGGVLKRAGQTEGSVDLTKLAGLRPAAVICEVMNENGSMSRRDELAEFSRHHGILMVTIKDLIEYRIKQDTLVTAMANSRVPLNVHGDFMMTVFSNQLDDAEHFALYKKSNHPVPLVRIHSECITGDVFGSMKCDCGSQLQQSLALLAEEGGVLIYLRQEGRGIGLANKLKAYALQEQGYDTVDANLALGLPVDARDYAVAYQILKYFDMNEIRLVTNNPEKIQAISQYGVIVKERISLTVQSTTENRAYLKTKQAKMGHLLAID
jgi:3,4-dihydroxy 2-butanone 4-phosphate synthase/GTP cyclohydrolase II